MESDEDGKRLDGSPNREGGDAEKLRREEFERLKKQLSGESKEERVAATIEKMIRELDEERPRGSDSCLLPIPEAMRRKRFAQEYGPSLEWLASRTGALSESFGPVCSAHGLRASGDIQEIVVKGGDFHPYPIAKWFWSEYQASYSLDVAPRVDSMRDRLLKDFETHVRFSNEPIVFWICGNCRRLASERNTSGFQKLQLAWPHGLAEDPVENRHSVVRVGTEPYWRGAAEYLASPWP